MSVETLNKFPDNQEKSKCTKGAAIAICHATIVSFIYLFSNDGKFFNFFESKISES